VKFGGETEFSAALEPGKYLALQLQEEGSFSENERERASERACRMPYRYRTV
jgi:hypothetical protein